MNPDKNQGGLDMKRIAVNMVFSVIGFVLNLGISFFITPYITAQFGAEAYGFVKLANDFSSYASILSIALNSMASRFIMLERTQGHLQEAQKYYVSVTAANVVLTGVLMIPSILVVSYLERLLEIPAGMVAEVKLTFAITFAGFLINLIFSTHSNCFYLTNRLDISALRDAAGSILKVAAILLLFLTLSPRISYVALGTLVSTVGMCLCNLFYTKKLTPELKTDLRLFSFRKLWQVLSAGVWNSITRLSQVFSSGLDLLVTNLFVGAEQMGYLSVAKTLPTMIASFNATVANVFSPNLMMLYAKNDIEGLKRATKLSMRFMCLFVAVPCSILITMGVEFFRLWVPEQPAVLINILSILTVINSCVTGPMQPLYQIFTVTNKIRQSSIAMIIFGFSSILVTYVFVRFTPLGVYAVAGVSLVGSLLVALFYHLPYSAIYIGLPWHTFFPEIGKSVVSLVLACGVGFAVNAVLTLDSWLMWFVGAAASGLISVAVNMMLILNAEERAHLLQMVRNKLKK